MKRISIAMLVSLFASVVLWAGEPQILTMKIEGMTCGLCEVKKQLSSVCKDMTIDREKGEGICKYEDPVTPDQVLSEATRRGSRRRAPHKFIEPYPALRSCDRPRSRPRNANQMVPSAPNANATSKFTRGLICHKKAPPNAARETITSRIR